MDRHTSGHNAAGRIDVHPNIFFGIVRLQIQKLRYNLRRHIVFDLTRYEDDPFRQQTRIEIGHEAAIPNFHGNAKHLFFQIFSNGKRIGIEHQ
jgi:hypothetical protein